LHASIYSWQFLQQRTFFDIKLSLLSLNVTPFFSLKLWGPPWEKLFFVDTTFSLHSFFCFLPMFVFIEQDVSLILNKESDRVD
jgi:hypothetical protein